MQTTGKALLLTSFLALMPIVATYAKGDGEGPRLLRWGRQLLSYIDTLALKGVDRDYIGVPERPWQVVVRGNTNRASLDMSSTINDNDIFAYIEGEIDCDYHIRSGQESYVGVWGGYRGYGLGYSRAVGAASDGSLLTLGMTGSHYGLNLRHHHFLTDEIEVHDRGTIMGNTVDTTAAERLASPVHVRSVIVDAYYMFNGRRFSYSAAYDQSAYQLRSAGSFMVGAMYYYANIDYADPQNDEPIFMMDDIGQLRQWQFSLGAGYAYNYVPTRGVLVSAMLMPMLTAYNRLQTYRYNSVLKQFYLKQSDIGIIDLIEMDEAGKTIWPDEKRHKTSEMSRMTLNFNARASVTWNIGERAYLNAYGQLYNFRFRHDNNRGALTEWFVNAALGLRF